jgi:hypothetical protein
MHQESPLVNSAVDLKTAASIELDAAPRHSRVCRESEVSGHLSVDMQYCSMQHVSIENVPTRHPPPR